MPHDALEQPSSSIWRIRLFLSTKTSLWYPLVLGKPVQSGGTFWLVLHLEPCSCAEGWYLV
jgi:hypothetical protein